MKNKIIEILMSETFNTSDEAGNSYIVTSSEDFDDIAERIVKLFAIPDVSNPVICPNCGQECEPIPLGLICNKCYYDKL